MRIRVNRSYATVTPLSQSPFTYNNWLARPETNTREEVLAGELIVSPAPGWVHALVVKHLFRLFDRRAIETGAGEVMLAPLGVRLSEYDVPEPDLLFIRADRIAELVVDGRIVGPPDLVVEVISKTSVRRDAIVKFGLYAKSGVAEYWLVDPARRSISVFELNHGHYQLVPVAADGVHRSKVIPGLAVSGEACFAGIGSESAIED